jgi:hypothetical protein
MYIVSAEFSIAAQQALSFSGMVAFSSGMPHRRFG